MSRKLVVAIVVLPSIAITAPALAQCTKDIECKGNRICESGRCVAAAPATPAWPAPLTATPALGNVPAPQLAAGQPLLAPTAVPTLAYAYYPRAPKVIAGYGVASAFFGVGGRGSREPYDWRPGFHLAGLRAFSNRFHFGGYFSFSESKMSLRYSAFGGYEVSDETRSYSAGISLKAGGWIRQRVWLGFLLDHGMRVYTGTLIDTAVGTELSPRLHLDALITNTGVKLGLSASIGPQLIYNEREGVVVYTAVTLGMFLGG